MKVIKKISEIRNWSAQERKSEKTIGFVPTMGYLHEGHLSLIREAKKYAEDIVVSIYVNPAQFAPGEDFERYPRDFERDENLCRKEDVAVVFYPDDREMYGKNHNTYVINEELSRLLCGKSRPTHFRGVATVVAKLFNIVQPHLAVFGQKDAQQFVILKKMVDDLNFNVKMMAAPIVRETDGLAMSSRNKYLNSTERREAVVLYESLKMAEKEYDSGNMDFNDIIARMHKYIQHNSSARIDYIEYVNYSDLGPVDPQKADTLIALAAYFGKTRLIDNTILKQR
ncbi:MAG: pantoate--beta-alanine ligase [Calditrichaceae bacterium]|nr:pantoate--beta-alanine ligase [Calditrichaceae bacterium]MBN2707900.1 pantoate--beta-alanine ligase [Calditrichaceae bacterium]RQV97847.1 MAG: pantoate--beta-alanine ligase [Calditrichota bacterium]